jgi:hypothetical protein
MRGAFGWGWWTHDPGPCPVDDTPHTACTPESVALTQSLSPSQQTQACTVVVQPPAVFSTGTYRRALHAPGARAGPSEPARVTPPPAPAVQARTGTKGRRR